MYEHEHHEHEEKFKMLTERYEEEVEDAHEYYELSEKYPECAPLFYKIGSEEVTHAYHLREKLLERGHVFSAEHEAKWHKVLREYGWGK